MENTITELSDTIHLLNVSPSEQFESEIFNIVRRTWSVSVKGNCDKNWEVSSYTGLEDYLHKDNFKPLKNRTKASKQAMSW